ncbi:uncharacterized protein TrAtP1_002306 [Trichoderma atroviride]|uniref:uncharacterized protein n=1 Tax=Hypocrea atroviridis TaxID=63577 RepID=UPI00332A9252|nr:hypothetical protein TrAtP1_002306 [Trichoderma atroviride]
MGGPQYDPGGQRISARPYWKNFFDIHFRYFKTNLNITICILPTSTFFGPPLFSDSFGCRFF